MRRILLAGLTLALVTLTNLPGNADAWVLPNQNAGADEIGFSVNQETATVASHLRVYEHDVNDHYVGQTACTAIGVSPCDMETVNNSFVYWPGTTSRHFVVDGGMQFPKCDSPVQTFCIESVEISQGDTKGETSFSSYLTQTSIPAAPEIGMPKLATAGVWTSSVKNGGDSSFYVGSVFAYFMVKNGRFEMGNFNALVQPIHLASSSICAIPVGQECGIPEDFAPNTTAAITFRAPNTLGGWYFGRIGFPNITVDKIDATTNRVRISGQPVGVQRFSTIVKLSDPVTAYLPIYDSPNLTEYIKKWGHWTGVQPTTLSDGKKFIDAIRPQVDDRASGVSDEWRVGTYGASNQCFQDLSKVNGLVSTNSLLYQSTAPDFDGTSLSFKVAGMHKLPDGKLAQGTYDLLLTDDAVKCLYGLSGSSVRAEVSVTSEDGVENVATTVVSDKDGWWHLSAHGFTFSDPTIRVTFTDPTKESSGSGQTPSPSPTPSSSASSQPKSITITCIKGKVKKKVVGVKPKCPTGYKRG